MKLSKFIFLIVFITLFSILYVYQQTEIFHLAYDSQKKLAIFEDLLDKNTILRYNIARNASLIRINNKVSAKADFQMPDAYKLVKVRQPLEDLQAAHYVSTNKENVKENIIARLFGVKRQAEARTIVFSH